MPGTSGFRSPTVFIDRHYEDPFEVDPPWPRRRRWAGDPLWKATCEYGDRSEEADFDSVEEAIAWARQRAERVFVRLGSTNETVYTAGEEQAIVHRGETFPSWPPDNWPDYLGPAAEPRRHSPT